MKILILAALCVVSCCAQTAVRVDPLPASTVSSSGSQPYGYPQMLAIPNAQVTLCGYPANGFPCTNFATAYTDATAGTACASGDPVVLSGSSTCSDSSDRQGNFGFWVVPGNYTYMLTVKGVTYGPYPISAGSGLSLPLGQANGGTGTNYPGSVYALAYCTTPLSPDETCVNNAFAANVGDTVIVSKPITIKGLLTVPSFKHIEFLTSSNYAVQNGGSIAMGVLSTMTCPGGPEQTVFNIPSTATSGTGFIDTTVSGIGTGQTVEGCGFSYTQPSTATRTAMIHYPPTILAGQRTRFLHNKITQGWNGIDCTHAPYCGGMLVDDLQISTFNNSFTIDNVQDVVRLNSVHIWPFGITTDANKMAAFIDPANFGILSGRCDGLFVNAGLFFIGTGAFLYNGTGAIAGPGFGHFTDTGFDSYNGITVLAGEYTMAGGYFSLVGTRIGLNSAGGSFSLAGVKFISDGGASFIDAAGGNVQVNSGQVALGAMAAAPFRVRGGDLRVNGLQFELGALDQTMFSNETGYMNVENVRFNYLPNVTYTLPRIEYTSTGSRGIVGDNTMSDTGSGSAVLLNVPVNTWVFAHHNMLLGSTLNPASTSGLIHIDNNF